MSIRSKKALLAVVCMLALAMPCAAFAASGTADKAAGTGADTATAQTSAVDKDGKVPGKDSGKDTDKASTEAATTEKSAGASEELLAWAEGMDCTGCHTNEKDSLENEDCTVSIHNLLGLACTDCHADDALITVHEKVTADSKMPKKLKKSEVNTAICETCHDVAELAKTTADSTVLTDEEGTTVNPHELPDVEEHANITCVSCHKMHSDKTVAKAASDTCTNCHHENVYECFTCHS